MPTTDPATKDLKEMLEEAIHERDELNTFIRLLQQRMGGTRDDGVGVTVPAGQVSLKGHAPEVFVAPGVDPLTIVFPGMFFGKTQSQASEALLEAFKRPVKTPKMITCLRQGGLALGSKNAATNLWKTLSRNEETFVLVPKAGWGLVKWYDAKVIAKMRAGGSDTENAEEENGQ